MTQNGISYVLNASNSCPKPDFICESRFMRIPINDNYCEKLLPWLDKSIEFIGEGGACAYSWGWWAGGVLLPERWLLLLAAGRAQFPYLGEGRTGHSCTHLVPIPRPPDKAKLSSCQVIVHCLAGISRSATIAIAYIMKTMGMSSDDAYR